VTVMDIKLELMVQEGDKSWDLKEGYVKLERMLFADDAWHKLRVIESIAASCLTKGYYSEPTKKSDYKKAMRSIQDHLKGIRLPELGVSSRERNLSKEKQYKDKSHEDKRHDHIGI